MPRCVVHIDVQKVWSAQFKVPQPTILHHHFIAEDYVEQVCVLAVGAAYHHVVERAAGYVGVVNLTVEDNAPLNFGVHNYAGIDD